MRLALGLPLVGMTLGGTSFVVFGARDRTSLIVGIAALALVVVLGYRQARRAVVVGRDDGMLVIRNRLWTSALTRSDIARFRADARADGPRKRWYLLAQLHDGSTRAIEATTRELGAAAAQRRHLEVLDAWLRA